MTTTAHHARRPDRCTARNGRGVSCGSAIERSHLLADVLTVTTRAWCTYAAATLLEGRLPRTMVVVVPSLTGALGPDLGRGATHRGVAFGGQAHAGATALDAPADPCDFEVTVVDEFESRLDWPMWCPRGTASA